MVHNNNYGAAEALLIEVFSHASAFSFPSEKLFLAVTMSQERECFKIFCPYWLYTLLQKILHLKFNYRRHNICGDILQRYGVRRGAVSV